MPVASVPALADRSVDVATTYALLGNAPKALEVLNQHEARLDTLARRRETVDVVTDSWRIAMADGKTDSAMDVLPTRR